MRMLHKAKPRHDRASPVTHISLCHDTYVLRRGSKRRMLPVSPRPPLPFLMPPGGGAHSDVFNAPTIAVERLAGWLVGWL